MQEKQAHLLDMYSDVLYNALSLHICRLDDTRNGLERKKEQRQHKVMLCVNKGPKYNQERGLSFS